MKYCPLYSGSCTNYSVTRIVFETTIKFWKEIDGQPLESGSYSRKTTIKYSSIAVWKSLKLSKWTRNNWENYVILFAYIIRLTFIKYF